MILYRRLRIRYPLRPETSPLSGCLAELPVWAANDRSRDRYPECATYMQSGLWIAKDPQI
jgi:hypothetical protein